MAQTQQLVPIKDQINNVRSLILKSEEEIKKALPRHIRAEQFIRTALTTIRRNPDLLKCTQDSLMGCLMESAQLGLQVDGMLGEAHLVPFNRKTKTGQYIKECQLIPGYKGYMKLGRNSGEVASYKAKVVYRDDELTVEEGLSPKLVHRRSEEPPQLGKGETLADAVRGAYAVVTLKDGSSNFVFLWKWEIDRARATSKAAMKDGGPWDTNYPEMAEKTAMRRLAKYMPQSAEIQKAAALEDMAEVGLSQGLSAGSIDIEVEEVEPDTTERLKQLEAEKAPTSTPLDNPNFAEGSDPEPDPFTGE